jgi:NADH-quinone oxidoreductase subunit F
MDVHVTTAPPSEAEREAVDEVLGPARSGWTGGDHSDLDRHVALAGRRRALALRPHLLPALHALQERTGWISPPALGYVCTRLDLAPAEAYGVASAYALFSFETGPEVVVHVCDDIACRVAAGADPMASLPAGAFKASPCLGHCEHGSAALVQKAGDGGGRVTVAPFTASDAAGLGAPGADVELATFPPAAELVPQRESDPASLRLLRRVGTVAPDSLDSYRAAGGYECLRRAVELGPAGVIRELAAARLLGRGGAAFPTAAKWEAVASNPVRPHYFVANADESEPGTFKDRVLLDHDPFALVEATTVAGLTTGAERGYVYVRGEYPLAARRLASAVEQASRRGLLGDDVMGSGLRFELEVRTGAGAYIAGEETALFNSIEGRRPEPRNKPPYPAESGLFGKPTGVNNVETLLSVLEVLAHGGEVFARVGTEHSTGTRLFCLSGCVARPGLYEVPLGTSLRALLDLAGGVSGGRPLQAVLLGGAAGTFVGPEELDLELSFEGARAAGATLGSGVVLVLDDRVEVVTILRRIAQFFRDESCGQCVPCRVGTQRQEEVLARLASAPAVTSAGANGWGSASPGTGFGAVAPGNGSSADLLLLGDLDAVMRDASICGLGQTASSAVMSALSHGLVGYGRDGS